MGKRNILVLICFVSLTCSCATATYNPCGSRYSWHRTDHFFLYGFETIEGKTIVEPKFTFASHFSDGFALVCVSKKEDSDTCGFIDKTGRYVLTGLGGWLDVDSFSEGLTAIKKGGKYGYIDKTLKFVIPPQFDDAGGFAEGLAAVEIGNKYGYIDKTGKFVIPPQFDAAGGFSEGLAAVKIGNKYGYIDKTLKFVIPPQFDLAAYFSEGLAAVGMIISGWQANYGFIDRTGRVVIEPQFSLTSGFQKGLAAVCIDVGDESKWGLIDKTGRYIIKPQFKEVYISSDFERIRVTYWDGSEANIDTKGKIVKKLKKGEYFLYDGPPTEGIYMTRHKVICVDE